ILIGGLTKLCQGAPTDSPETSPTMTIHVYNYAEVSPETLGKAEKIAARIFGKAGVEIRWYDWRLNSGENKEASAQPEPLHTSDIFLKILPRSMTESFGL